MAKELGFILLLDCYGEFLTEKQRQAAELYYGEDLSLAEIAEITGTTRQAVRDSIKRSEQVLHDMEQKLQFAAKICALRENYQALDAALREMPIEQTSGQKLLSLVQEGLSLL